MTNRKLSDIEFKLEWKSTFAEHADTLHVHNVDLNNEKFPVGFAKKITALKLGESCSQTFQAKDILGESHSSHKVMRFDSALFDNNFKGQFSPPTLYRFYPSAIAWQGLNTESTDYTPFRLISMSGDTIVADRNHPLAKYYLTLTASKINEYDVSTHDKQHKRDIGRLITSRGPGMQIPFEFGDSIFFDQYPFDRQDAPEPLKPQIDPSTIAQIAKHYSQLLAKHSKVLDLMSGEHSYLADDYETGLLTGIGANEDALNANDRLNTYQIQNLNVIPILPFEKNSFDDAICTLSIEYLSDPVTILKEVARVVNYGGKFIITFSNNPSTSTSINLWGQLHPFERIQLVLEYFRNTEMFIELKTFSKRGVLLNPDKKEYNKNNVSAPFYGVWGVVNQS